jgi:hypothetical protein
MDAGRFTERGSTLKEGAAQYTESVLVAKGRLFKADELQKALRWNRKAAGLL